MLITVCVVSDMKSCYLYFSYKNNIGATYKPLRLHKPLAQLTSSSPKCMVARIGNAFGLL